MSHARGSAQPHSPHVTPASQIWHRAEGDSPVHGFKISATIRAPAQALLALISEVDLYSTLFPFLSKSVQVQRLGRALHRPAILPVPAFALTLALGEMGQALLLSSQRAVPARALALGWTFRYPEIDAALEAVARA